MRVTVSMVDYYPVYWCHQKTGIGNVREAMPKDRRPGDVKSRLKFFTWTASSRGALEILDCIWPYVKVKRRQISLARLCMLAKGSVSNKPGDRQTLERAVTNEAFACLEMQKANQRGAREPRLCRLLDLLKPACLTDPVPGA